MQARAVSAFVAAAALSAAVFPMQRISAQPSDPLARGVVVPTALPTLMLPAVPSIAPGYAAPRASQSPAALIGVTAQPFVGISLQDAIAMALLRNPNLAVSASNYRIAQYNVVQVRGAYDLQLHLEPSSNFSVNPPENFLAAGPGDLGHYPNASPTTGPGNIIQHQSGFAYGLNGETVNGTTYDAQIQQSRTYNNTVFDAFNPYYLATLNVAVTQPLLKNAGMNATKRQLKLALINADSGTAQTLIDASTAIARVEDVYWNLVGAWRDVAIREEALRQATAQQRSNVRLARRGAAAPIDAVASETQVATFENDVVVALQSVAQLQNELKTVVTANASDPLWNANLVPSTSVQQPPTADDLATVVAKARRNRPEVRQADARRRQADIDVVYAKNQSLPQADVQAQYESNGFAGIPAPVPKFITSNCLSGSGLAACPTPPPNTQGSMPFAYHNMWAAYFPTFNLALVVGYPLQGRVARGLRGLAGEETAQAKILIQGVQERIGAEARNALQSYQSATSRLAAARRARESAEAVYASESRKFQNGASTTFLVLQRQVQLAQARGNELQAQTQLNEAAVELQRVEGTILQTNGVNVETLGSKALAP